MARSIKSAKIDSLELDPENARKHTELDINAIATSLKAFGQQTPIVVDARRVVVKGNGTLMAARQLGWKAIDIVETTLTGERLRAYSIADNQTALLSTWDTDTLVEQLKALEADQELFSALGFQDEQLQELLGASSTGFDTDGEGNPYTGKVTAPQYETHGPAPELESLFDDEKYRKLIAGIEAASIPEDQKQFLRLAAGRHVVFNFARIAEYYAHASADVQQLFEDSALVIIDFDAAIENGYARLEATLSDIFESEWKDGEA